VVVVVVKNRRLVVVVVAAVKITPIVLLLLLFLLPGRMPAAAAARNINNVIVLCVYDSWSIVGVLCAVGCPVNSGCVSIFIQSLVLLLLSLSIAPVTPYNTFLSLPLSISFSLSQRGRRRGLVYRSLPGVRIVVDGFNHLTIDDSFYELTFKFFHLLCDDGVGVVLLVPAWA
jgi:hypothetical protein